MLKHKEDDIRRRLTIAEVPRPPADLVQKIKHDIPKHFTSMTAKEVEKNNKAQDPTPLWNIWGFSWQLAASILVLVGLTWAVFEAYRTEVNEAAKVADTGKDVMSVDEFESRVTKEPDVLRVEGAAAPSADAGEAVGEMKKEQQPAPAATAVPASPPPPPTFAPEPAKARRANDVRPRTESDDERAKQALAEESVERPQAQVATATPAGRELVDAPAADALARNEAGPVAQPAAAAEPVVSTAAVSTESVAAPKSVAARRIVYVKGLKVERVVTVEVDLDADGRVVSSTIPGIDDKAILDAIASTSKTWVIKQDRDAAERRNELTRIEVQLRKGN